MKEFEPKLINKDPYSKWQESMIREGITDANKMSELNFIEYAINKGSAEEIDKAIIIARSFYNSREDLIASLCAKKDTN